MQLIFRRFYNTKSDVDVCTLSSDRTLINRRNVKSDPHSAYRANRDFLLITIKSRIISAAMKVLGFESKESTPSNFQLPENLSKSTKIEKMKLLHNAAGMVVDQFVFDVNETNKVIDKVICDNQQLNQDGRFPCRFQGCSRSFKYDGKVGNHAQLLQNPQLINIQRIQLKIQLQSQATKTTIYLITTVP